ITEHRDGAAPELFERVEFELHVQADFGRDAFGELTQIRAIRALAPERITPHEEIEFKVVVRTVTRIRLQHPAFAATVTAAQHQPFELLKRDDSLKSDRNRIANSSEKLFEFHTAIEGEPLRGGGSRVEGRVGPHP